MIWFPDAAGSLYGTTYVGGNTGNGVIYKLTQNAKGNWIEKPFSLVFNYHDGASPADNPVTFDAAGNLFCRHGLRGCTKATTDTELCLSLDRSSRCCKQAWLLKKAVIGISFWLRSSRLSSFSSYLT